MHEVGNAELYDGRNVKHLPLINRDVARSCYDRVDPAVVAKPRALFVELTRACNLSCPMCRTPGSVSPSQRMTEATFSYIQDTLLPHAELVDLRGWGESLLLPDFSARLKAVHDMGCKTRIVSNLSVDRPRVIETLSEYGTYVAASIDAVNDVTLRTLRRGANPRLIFDNLALVIDGHSRRGLLHRVAVYVTLQAPALGDLPKLVDHLVDLGVRDIRLAPLTVGADDPYGLGYRADEVLRALSDVARTRSRISQEVVSLTASPIDPSPSSLRQMEPCTHPWFEAYITYDGRLGFCDHLIGPEGDPYTMGVPHVDGLESTWNGERMRELREEHVELRRATAPDFDHCSWCYRNRYLDHEDILDPHLASSRVYLSDFLEAAGASP